MNSNSTKEKSKRLNDLSPFDYCNKITSTIKEKNVDKEYYKIYESAINQAIANPKIKNVGITGGYGSGKSSIVHSYFDNKSREKTIFISLAHFSSLAGNQLPSSSENINSEIDNILELKIVNQLVNQIEPKKIPKANFTAKQNTHRINIIILTLLISYIIFYLKFFSTTFSEKLIYSLKHSNPIIDLFDGILIILTFTFLCACFYIIKILTTIIINKNFTSKVSMKLMGMSVDLEDKTYTSISYFDNFLLDVIYIFDESEADFVIFEDLDRFSDHTIFEKLREINFMVNHRREIKKKNKIMFIYVVGDDIFSQENSNKNIEVKQASSDRTKFFDLIIPVVPIVNHSNSFDYLKDELTSESADDEFVSFLFQISIFIDDFRLLKNIVNEYKIYSQIHDMHFDVNPKQLLSLIVLKSLNIKEFNDFTKSKGELFMKIKEKMENTNG